MLSFADHELGPLALVLEVLREVSRWTPSPVNRFALTDPGLTLDSSMRADHRARAIVTFGPMPVRSDGDVVRRVRFRC